MNIRGIAHKFSDNVNTDEIIPAEFLNTTDEKELGSHCMKGILPGFSKKIARGDIIVAGKNFGCGSSREHAALAIKGCGASAVIAETFARIFFRNAINIGFPILESPEASADIQEGDKIQIDLASGEIKNCTKNKTYRAQAFPEFLQKIISSGGLMEYVKARLEKQ